MNLKIGSITDLIKNHILKIKWQNDIYFNYICSSYNQLDQVPFSYSQIFCGYGNELANKILANIHEMFNC